MLQISDTPVSHLDPAQATELSLLVDLEACWQNLREPSSGHPHAAIPLKDLSAKQRAYEAFRSALAAYNGRYTPTYLPEQMLNSPVRLEIWCRKMRDLYLQLEHDARLRCPVHVLEKAYRSADRIAVRLNRDPVSRTTPLTDIPAVIRDLETLEEWCTALAAAAAPAAKPTLSLVGAA